MKKFKQIDYWISILLIIGFAVAGLINQDATFLIGYFVVGGWQVISMTFHAINKWFTEKGSRRYIYHCIVLCILLLALAGLMENFILSLLAFPMLFAAPFMAIY